MFVEQFVDDQTDFKVTAEFVYGGREGMADDIRAQGVIVLVDFLVFDEEIETGGEAIEGLAVLYFGAGGHISQGQ